MSPVNLQPDQDPGRWDHHVSLYEAVFEPFTLQFAREAIAKLEAGAGQTVLDVAAGAGGAALELARHGCHVVAIDASPGMVGRIHQRAERDALAVEARVMEGERLAFPDQTFEAALSVFGVILFPNAVKGLAEMRRVVRPGGRVAVVTWTEPQSYELAAILRSALLDVLPDHHNSSLPAQLRYCKRDDFAALFRDAGLADPAIEVVEAHLTAPSARWLALNIGFAPGMRAQVEALGGNADTILSRFVAKLEEAYGVGPFRLAGKAFVGVAAVTIR